MATSSRAVPSTTADKKTTILLCDDLLLGLANKLTSYSSYHGHTTLCQHLKRHTNLFIKHGLVIETNGTLVLALFNVAEDQSAAVTQDDSCSITGL